MLHITLGPARELGPQDELGRARTGYADDMSETELYNAGRAAWVLGARADRETHALLTHAGVVRQAIRIDHLENVDGGRRAIVGEVLHSGDGVYDAYVGKPSPVTGVRNPVTYFEPETGQRTCRCGCETELPPGSGQFVPGHDQRALHARVAQIGTVADFLDWFDRTYEPETAS